MFTTICFPGLDSEAWKMGIEDIGIDNAEKY